MFDLIKKYDKANILEDVGFFDLVHSYVLQLLKTDFNLLVSLLYQIDVDETKVQRVFKGQEPEEIALAVTKLIIDRIHQKNRFRSLQ